MNERITSRQNPLCKHVKKLRSNRAYRYECREFLADGLKLVGEALRWGRVKTLLLREDVRIDGVPADVRTVFVPQSVMQDLSRMDTPQGAIAVCAMPEPASPDVQPGSLILDGIQDPGNLGTILRTADAFETQVLLGEGCADPYGEKTVRASMGAVLRTPPIQADTDSLLAACKEKGIPLCVTALTPEAADIRDCELHRCATVIGSEGQGVRKAFLDAAERTAMIPMSPRCESLNAAVAATVVLWQKRCQSESGEGKREHPSCCIGSG